MTDYQTSLLKIGDKQLFYDDFTLIGIYFVRKLIQIEYYYISRTLHANLII